MARDRSRGGAPDRGRWSACRLEPPPHGRPILAAEGSCAERLRGRGRPSRNGDLPGGDGVVDEHVDEQVLGGQHDGCLCGQGLLDNRHVRRGALTSSHRFREQPTCRASRHPAPWSCRSSTSRSAVVLSGSLRFTTVRQISRFLIGLPQEAAPVPRPGSPPSWDGRCGPLSSGRTSLRSCLTRRSLSRAVRAAIARTPARLPERATWSTWRTR